MNVLTQHPNLYQFTHWWHWLAYGQNAAVVQALAAIAATGAAISAGIFAAKTYAATIAQLKIVNAQLELAKQQFGEERSRYAAEKQRTVQAARTMFRRLRSEEESLRPRFRNTVGYTQSGGVQNFRFENCGKTPALDASFVSLDGARLLHTESYVAPSSGVSLRIDVAELSKGIRVNFRTEFGSAWKTVVNLIGEVPLPAVESDYEPLDS